MPIDFVALSGMLLPLLIVVIVAGVILLLPLTRRLGALMEQRLEEKKGAAPDSKEIAELRQAVERLQGEVERLSEQQSFTEALLEKRGRTLPPG